MKSFLAFAALLPLGLCNPEWATNPPTLVADHPIYLANVFSPPEMHFLAFAPPKDSEDLYTLDDLEWCKSAVDVTDNMSSGSRTPPFTFKGMDGLKIHDYFTDNAYITRHNYKFADCVVTPESMLLGNCPGEKRNGHKFSGLATRVWSCYILSTPDKKGALGPREDVSVDLEKTIDQSSYVGAKSSVATVGSTSKTAFTAPVTTERYSSSVHPVTTY